MQFDVKQNIGKRYARMDEAGTHPTALRLTADTLEDQTVTVRYRDTLEQERIGIDKGQCVPGRKKWGNKSGYSCPLPGRVM